MIVHSAESFNDDGGEVTVHRAAETLCQRAEYLESFLAALLLAAAPALVEDEDEALMLDRVQGSAIAPSKKW